MDKFEQDCDAALGWIARFRSGHVSEGDRQDFALWLASDADHGRAMDAMQNLWDDLGCLAHLPDIDAINAPQAPARRRWLGAGLAIAASALLATVLLPQLQPEPPVRHQFQTALGERRTVTLEDGSQITLNTNTRLSAELGEAQRRVILQEGEAFFEVAPDAGRPFEVTAGSAQITVVGTAFNVLRRDARHSEITVSEGVVRVTEADAPSARAAASEILHANQRLQASPEGFSASAAADVSAQLAWRRGELIAREMPLAQLARELERYQNMRIIVADPAVAALTVSGVFQLDQPLAVLDALERSHNLRVSRYGSHSLQLLPAPQ
ncbi:FecR family protein [Parahaliea mediterranea]|uniref:FecR family protein n=1 Tax=Parahaliea mediterranea TaxID=651086 RepID=UPI000E2F8B8A|nr:FecR family protein [Parahaliea mediterranea]